MANAFNEAIARATAKGWAEGAKRMRMEKRMASALVKAILARGCTISIHNGEDWACRKVKTYRTAMDALWQTDEESVLAYDGANRLGTFWLVYGNDGYDLVADFNDNEFCNEVWKTVLQPLSDKLCMEAVG